MGETIFHSGFTPDSVKRATAMQDGSMPMINSPQSPLGQFEKSLSALRGSSRSQSTRQTGEIVEAKEDMLLSKYMTRRQLNFDRDDPTGEKRAGIARAAARLQARADAASASKLNLAVFAPQDPAADAPNSVFPASRSPLEMKEKPLPNLPAHPSTVALPISSPLALGVHERVRPQTSAARTQPSGPETANIPVLRQTASDTHLNQSYLTLVTVLSPSPSQISLLPATPKKFAHAKLKVRKGFSSVTNSVKALGQQIHKLSPRIDVGSQKWGRSPKAKHNRLLSSISKGKTVISGPIGDLVHDYQVEGESKEQVKSAVYEGSIPLVRKPIMSELGGGAATLAEIQSGEGNPIEYSVSGLRYFNVENRESPRSADKRVSKLPSGVSRSQLPVTPVVRRQSMSGVSRSQLAVHPALRRQSMSGVSGLQLPVTPIDRRQSIGRLQVETPRRLERGVLFEDQLFEFENGLELDSRIIGPVQRDFAASHRWVM